MNLRIDIGHGRTALVGMALAAALSAGQALAQPRPPQGPPPSPPAGAAPRSGNPQAVVPNPNAQTVTIQVPVNSAMSLVHVGSSDSFAITTEGRQAAQLLLDALEEKDPEKARDKARQSSAIYDEIIPRENYGGEYSALQWFANYFAADPKDRPAFLQDPEIRFFFSEFGGEEYTTVKEYLKRKYRLAELGDEDTRAGQDRKKWLEDTILFNNPRRESWDKSTELLKLLKIKPGMKIADVGSGPGYYSFKFAKLVGPEGHVYAIDMDADHLKYVERGKEAMGVTNISTVETDGRTIGLAGLQVKVDAIFLCSLYHNIYAMSTQPERDALIDSIKDAMVDDGVLYLVDNGLVEPGVLPYHGPYIAKELIIGQMLNYGFDLVEQGQHIPQRYLLVFKKRKDEAAPGTGPARPEQRAEQH